MGRDVEKGTRSESGVGGGARFHGRGALEVCEAMVLRSSYDTLGIAEETFHLRIRLF